MKINSENIFRIFFKAGTALIEIRKRNLFFFIVLVFAAAPALKSQSIFILQNPAYSPEQINGITFSGNHGLCAGNYGMVMSSSNGGMNWVGIYPFTNSNISRIFLFNQNNGYLTADSNRFYLTGSGGSNWQAVYSFDSGLKDIFFLNQNTGFAVTSNKFWKTTSGGVGWSSFYPTGAGQNKYFSVYFTDQYTGYVSTKDPVSTYACILRTTNSGQNWISFNTYIDEFEAAKMYFVNPNTGWCAGNRFDKIFAMRTTDGGGSWSEGKVQSSSGALVGTFYSAVTGGFIVTENRIFRSSDYGNNWILYRSGLGYAGSYLKDDSMLYISDINGTLSRLNVNSGISVTILGSSNSTLSKISAVSRNYVYVSGSNHTFFKTNDGGSNWVADQTTGNYGFSDFYFTDSITGYGIIGRGDIMKTYYFGGSWDRIYSSSYEFNSVCFCNSNTGWVLGNGVILKTNNAGINWQVISASQNFDSPQFFSSQRGYCVGNNNLYFTSDGGNNWVQRGQGFVQYYNFLNEYTGWATNSFDTVTYIYRTTDGGLNLNEISHVNESAAQIKFLSAGTGYLCGKTKLYRTTDAGYTWKSARYPVSERIRITAMDIIDDNNGWVCGDNSAIIKIVNGGMIYAGNVSEFVPDDFALGQNYPNPFNQSSIINFQTSIDADIKLSVYDFLGREIITLLNERKRAGKYEVFFDGAGLASGIYFYVLKAENRVVSAKKMVMIK